MEENLEGRANFCVRSFPQQVLLLRQVDSFIPTQRGQGWEPAAMNRRVLIVSICGLLYYFNISGISSRHPRDVDHSLGLLNECFFTASATISLGSRSIFSVTSCLHLAESLSTYKVIMEIYFNVSNKQSFQTLFFLININALLDNSMVGQFIKADCFTCL